MKKLFFLLITVVALSTNSKANYNDGYDAGYLFGWQIVEIIVDTHPEYGIVSGNNTSYNTWSSNVNNTNPNMTLTTYVHGPNVGSNLAYDFLGSYSAFAAAEVAINHLWATGAYDWLMSQSTVSSWYLGFYDGFYYGTYDRMWAYQ